MPKLTTPPHLDDVDLQQESFAFTQTNPSDVFMKTFVMSKFYLFQNFRQTHEQRWNINDNLYLAKVPVDFWPGTTTPKANLGSHLIFEQVMGAYPLIAQALFSQPEFFSLEAGFGADPKAARAQQAHLDYGLNLAASSRGSSVENEFMNAIMYALLYGNGGVLIEYNDDLGVPDIQCVDLRDVYIDPMTTSGSIQMSSGIIIRKLMSVSEISKLRGKTNMDVPPDDVLYGLSMHYQTRSVDQIKSVQEGLRGNSYNVGYYANDAVPDDKKLEVLIWYSRSRICWILNGQWVLYNQPNIYGFIPAAFTSGYPIPGRFYALSIADIQADNQQYIQGLSNLRFDNAQLQQIPPRFMPRGSNYMPQHQAWGPGVVMGVDNVDNTYVHTFNDNTSSIYQELGFIRSDADRATGLGSMVSGQPQPSNANRTAGGIQAQLQGASLRLYPWIKFAEEQMIIPAITMACKMVRLHADRSKYLPGVLRNPDNQTDTSQVNVDPEAFTAETRVEVKAASKMLSRDRIMQYFQVLSQSLFTSQFQQQLNATGQTLDFTEILACLADATGMFRRYKFVREFTQEEIKQQQEQQKQSAQNQAPNERELAQMDYQARMYATQEKSQNEKLKIQADMQKNQPNPQELEIEREKANMEMQLKQMEMYFKKQMAELDAQIKQMEMQFKQQETQQKIISDRAKMANDQEMAKSKLILESAMGRAKLQQSQMDHEMNSQMSQENHQLEMRRGEESHQQQLKLASQQPKNDKPQPKK